MSSRRNLAWGVALLSIALADVGFAQVRRNLDPGLQQLEFSVDGTKREALVYVPEDASTNATPVVFIFHGHGGSSANAARTFGIHKHWPEAISVYMQGLNTPGRLTDPEGKRSGWQMRAGDQGDRDLMFFDAVLTS